MTNFIIINGKSLSPAGFCDEPVFVTDGQFAEVAAANATVIDAAGAYVLPGIIDIHGDAFERIMMPRPGVYFPLDIALFEADRQLIGNGITTAYHAVTVSWEPGLRSVENACQFVENLRAVRSRLACDTRLHLRWETFALAARDDVVRWLQAETRPILAFNDHTTADVQNGQTSSKIERAAARSGFSAEDYSSALQSIWRQRADVPAAIVEMAQRGLEAGATLLSHDEMSPQARKEFRALGVKSSEFPLTEATAQCARDANEHVILGAPNVVRGGSHNGALDAEPAIRDGLCSVLTSDYYYPAPLSAAFVLAERGICDLANAWAAVSAHPAQVAGLTDRGVIRAGMRADCLLVETEGQFRKPIVRSVMVAGAMALQRC